MLPSLIDAQWDPGLRRIVATTRNTARVAFDLGLLAEAAAGFRVELDGQSVDGAPPETEKSPAGTPEKVARGASVSGGMLRFEKSGGGWVAAAEASRRFKGPHRAGPFKDAFRHRMIFVYGTIGTPEENAWALAKARYDAESFWYRGNGSVDVVSDRGFDPVRYADRGVVVYGHADMNSAWAVLLKDSPVTVRRGEVRVGKGTVKRDDAACLFLQPRPDSDVASVAVIAGSGMPGLRLTRRLPYFMAGTAYPDCLVVASDALETGTAGIVTAGFFGNDWSVERGEFVWRDE